MLFLHRSVFDKNFVVFFLTETVACLHSPTASPASWLALSSSLSLGTWPRNTMSAWQRSLSQVGWLFSENVPSLKIKIHYL